MITRRNVCIKFSKCIFARYVSDSTIFNLSSGTGKCGVSVIRVSGPKTLEALRGIVSKEFHPKARYASLKTLHHPVSGEMIDKGLVLWFPGPNSFTGEDSCEFQVHGSIAVVKGMFDALASIPGTRMSNPGEFTKRAFFNGKLDLTEVDGLADLIHAETEAQRKQALLQSTGSLSKIYRSWRERLVKCVAHMEAYIDFAEDENIEDDLLQNLNSELTAIRGEIERHIYDHRKGEILRTGVRTAIIGAPNVGKSSLLNLLCQRKVSIVTPFAGTTRDIVEAPSNICGYPVLFADTAGLRSNTVDEVEKEGIDSARCYIQDCDLLLLVMDASVLSKSQVEKESFEHFKMRYLHQLEISEDLCKDKTLLVIVNKVDLVPLEELRKLNELDIVLVSCTQKKMDELMSKLQKTLKNICSQPTAEDPHITHSRYRQQLSKCLHHITLFQDECSTNMYLDLAISAQMLRNAVTCIGNMTGDVRTDDILDVVFRDFCIGK